MSSSLCQKQAKFTDNISSIDSGNINSFDGQYKNLNLNQNSNCHKVVISLPNESNSSNVKNNVNDIFNNKSFNSQISKGDLASKDQLFINFIEKEETVKWEKTKVKGNDSGSTLSLHIAAYESTITVVSGNEVDEEEHQKVSF